MNLKTHRIIYTTLTDSFVRDNNKDYIIDHGGKPNEECCYGICYVRPLQVFILARRHGERATDKTTLKIYRPDFSLMKEIDVPGCLGAHQIAADHKSRIYTTASITNDIYVTDLESEKSEAVHMDFGIDGGKEKDINHVNSLCFYDEALFVYCHNHGSSFISVLNRDEFVDFGRVKVERIYENVGVRGHNVYAEGRKMYSLSSAEGCLKCHARNTGEEIGRVDLEGRYLRGLHRIGKYLYIGGSHRGVRSYRSKPNQIAIFEVNMNTLEIEDTIKIESRANILDLYVIPDTGIA